MWKKILEQDRLTQCIYPIDKILSLYLGTESYVNASYAIELSLLAALKELHDKRQLTLETLKTALQNLPIFTVSFISKSDLRSWEPSLESFSDFSYKRGVLRVEYFAYPVVDANALMKCLKHEQTNHVKHISTQKH
ncbi:hypothetical protein [Motilimonas pumila]|uniref:Uncharacterized protein n=1 Tax=Motilimonas pumila TaxID=2303987 RepID=A0A418YA61_9GAMM|nr:hypothetical protein [Motilimonas pumila]RJG38987.1 hypothetical protein D1Z90_18615 [Motilimonas pumila]